MDQIAEMPVETNASSHPRMMPRVAAFVLGAIIFGVAYTQAELYFSNQNQYFLHGLAQTGFGYLRHDWLANTRDPAPLFSAVVAFTHRYLHDWFFYGYYVLVLGVYLFSLVGIAGKVAGSRSGLSFKLGFLALFVLIHSALLRWLSARAFGVDYPWYLQAGVAGQYILGPVFQPSVFGVLLFLSIYLFLEDRPLLAGAAAALAGVAHATYLLEAAFLVAAYLFLLARERRWRLAFGTGLLALLVVLPSVVYHAIMFGPTSAEQFADAQHILARFRIPHHTEVALWCDGIALGQVGWIFLGLALVRGHRLFAIMAISLAAAIGLTLLQMATGSDALALLFPWRASVYLVPLATTIVLARLMGVVGGWLEAGPSVRRTLAGGAAVFVLAASVVGGVVISYRGLGYLTSKEEDRVMTYVRDHKTESDLYMVPFDLPDRQQARPGAASGDFKPPRSVTEGIRRIAFGPQRFRLSTGAPVFIDIKSIPYRDVEVLEWRRRLDENDQLYAAMASASADASKEFFHRQGITHVIARRDQKVVWPELQEKVYEDEYFCIYRWVGK